MAGFSLGEITSLAASEILSFKDTLDLIKIRGEVMQEACNYKHGSMYSVIGADDETVEKVCDDINKININRGYVIPANYNCPGQVVISGEEAAVEAACAIFSEKNIRTIKLNVAGAFHTKLMQYKQDKLIKFLETLNFKNPKTELYSNLTGKKFVFDKDYNIDDTDNKNDRIKSLKSFMIYYIPEQMSNPVKFREELENLEKDGCDLFVEIGAGKVLSGFVKRTCKDAQICNIQDIKTLESAFELLK
jgi:[acyl-carrier-protein] S-malonyltransferase